MKYYSGNDKPYIYVSFAKANEEQVMPVMEKLSEEKVLFWCGGTVNYREKKRIEGAHAVLLFVTQEHLENADFRKTVDEAVRCNKNILTIYLEEVQMDPWGHMQLDSAQALYINSFTDNEAFIAKLKEAEIFSNMQVTEQQKRFKRNTTLTAIFTPLIAATLIFATVIYPRYFMKPQEPEQVAVEENDSSMFRGLTQEELDSIEFLTIIGNKVFTESDQDLQISESQDGTVSYSITFLDGSMEEGITEKGSISDLSDINTLHNLAYFKIAYNEITDISQLSEDIPLKSLELTGNPISDISGIDRFENLEFVRVDNTNIKDLSPLYNSNITGVSFRNTKVSEIDSDFTKQLNEIQGTGSKITEIPKLGPYEHMIVDIHRLNLKDDDMSFLEDVKSFDTFSIDGIAPEKLKPYMEGKPVYHQFSVASLNPKSLEELDWLNMMPGSYLGLDNSDRLNSLEGIEHFEGIDSIGIQHCDQIEDFTPLLRLKSLKHVEVSPSMLEKAERDLGGSGIEIIIKDVW